MARRLSEKPVVLARGFFSEDVANVFKETDVPLPVTVVGGGKAIGIELCEAKLKIEVPDLELGQGNSVGWSMTRATQSAVVTYAAEGCFIADESLTKSIGIGDQFINTPNSHHEYGFMCGEDGELIIDNKIHFQIKGGGNADTAVASYRLAGFLVEIDAEEALVGAVLDT